LYKTRFIGLIINTIYIDIIIYYIIQVLICIFYIIRDSIPGPLTNVLDGFNINENKKVRALTRHESINGQDPGVVGPIVWNLHCKQMEIKTSKF